MTPSNQDVYVNVSGCIDETIYRILDYNQLMLKAKIELDGTVI